MRLPKYPVIRASGYIPGMVERYCWRVDTSVPDMPLFRFLENLIETVLRELMACCTGFIATVAVFVFVSPTWALIGSIRPPPVPPPLCTGTGVANNAKSEKLEV